MGGVRRQRMGGSLLGGALRRQGGQVAPWWAVLAWVRGCSGPLPNTRFHLTAPPREYVDAEGHGGGAAGEAGR